MRSHVIMNRPGPFTQTTSVSPTSSSSSGTMEAEGEVKRSTTPPAIGVGTHYELRENPRKSFKFYETEFEGVDYSSFFQLTTTTTVPNNTANSASVVVQDRESDTETSIPLSNNFRRRSKRRRRRQRTTMEIEPMSSVSDNTPDEDVARCLMMLSRDIWSENKSTQNLLQTQHPSEDDDEDDDEEFTVVSSSDDDERRKKRVKKMDIGNGGRKARFQCGTCKKVFQSYQALGGHRASHKKIKSSCLEEQRGSKLIREFDDADPRLHECPFCFRMFISGQALGGHKRSHLAAGHSIPTHPPPPTLLLQAATKIEEDKMIDLNLPAPMENEVVEYAEFSAVSETC